MEKTMGRQVRSGDRVKTLVLTAVVAAMACAATLAVQIPSPTGGYLNLELDPVRWVMPGAFAKLREDDETEEP